MGIAKNLTVHLAVGGVLGTSLYFEPEHGAQPEQPHGEFLVPSLTVTFGASGNVSAGTLTVEYHPAVINLEWLRPHDHVIVQTTELIPPTENLTRSSIPPTGPDPFFQRRPGPSRLKVSTPKRPTVWCSSFQQFRPRRA